MLNVSGRQTRPLIWPNRRKCGGNLTSSALIGKALRSARRPSGFCGVAPIPLRSFNFFILLSGENYRGKLLSFRVLLAYLLLCERMSNSKI
jgi:hypothetical protein